MIIISFGTYPAVQAWLKETCASFQVLLDPERVVYRAYGLERSFLRSWGPKTIWRYVRLLAGGRKWRGIQGDSAQLGGDFIVDSKGILRLDYRSDDPTDRPSVESLLNQLRELQIETEGE
ncbi:MAG: redoxin domain-containing protein [Chloroflexi bacterium]|nr:redoxin domain-containing protein [Chloroflexota bacterium]